MVSSAARTAARGGAGVGPDGGSVIEELDLAVSDELLQGLPLGILRGYLPFFAGPEAQHAPPEQLNLERPVRPGVTLMKA